MAYRMLRILSVLCCVCFTPLFLQTAWGMDVAVVDVPRILSESQPGKAGEAHLKKAQEALQKGMDDVLALYKGKENTPEAQQALRESQVALERQLAVERQAVLQVLGGLLEKAVKDWRQANKKYTHVISSQVLLDFDKTTDVTAAVMKLMNLMTPKFAPLPTVTVNPPAASK